jgi:flagellar motor switch/type III secretory pathway protein FliN
MTGTELAMHNPEVSRQSNLNQISMSLSIPGMAQIEEHPSWEVLSQLRVKLRVVVALNRFRVRDLLALQKGQVFESLSPDTDDVTLLVGQVQLGWSEFEVLDQRMAVRMTRLS